MTFEHERTLSDLRPGASGRVRRIACTDRGGLELEYRLLEMGFAEGELIEVLHQGPVVGDPIAVKVCGQLLSLRRAEAAAVVIED